MRSVVVNSQTGEVINIIMAVPTAQPGPTGHILVELPSDLEHDIRRYVYTDGAFVPSAELQAEIDAELLALENEGLDFA